MIYFLTENEKCVKVLIQNGAIVDTKDNNGDNPLQLASNTGTNNEHSLMYKIYLYKKNLKFIVPLLNHKIIKTS